MDTIIRQIPPKADLELRPSSSVGIRNFTVSAFQPKVKFGISKPFSAVARWHAWPVLSRNGGITRASGAGAAIPARGHGGGATRAFVFAVLGGIILPRSLRLARAQRAIRTE